MDLFSIITILVVVSAAFAYINERFVKLPYTIGAMVITIAMSAILTFSGYINPDLTNPLKDLISQIDFSKVLLEIMLSFLLFAGALHTNFDQLKVQRGPILAFATFGVLVSTFLIGGAMYYLVQLFGMRIDFVHCLLFGSLISPTDPIAVLGILKKVGVPKVLETKIVGESLFNDGIGVVVFLTIFAVAEKGLDNITAGEVGFLLLEEVGGGVLLGAILGFGAYRLMKSIDDYSVEVLITLAIVMGGYLLALKLHMSGPLAVVVAGLIIGHDTVRDGSMSEMTELYIDKFWETLDALLNGILFVLIGLEILILPHDLTFFTIGLVAIPIILFARLIALSIPIKVYKKKLDFVQNTGLMMTWGGLRGGISIALALTMTQEMSRDPFLIITYVVVIFSIVVQGLTIGKVANKLIGKSAMQPNTGDRH
ncbi:MAG: cation:proton antiporter [Saprospiraceae bacterium]